ncbi:MAG: DUF5611 family protein [Euryarchaeota archaeon]|nr:DUF5611 family protein [Euryarchaeota archaeon]
MDYDVKKGHYSDIEGDGLRKIAESAFGKAEMKADTVTASYGAIESLEAKVLSKSSVSINTKMRTDVTSEVANETIKRYNTFLEGATGFTSKERRTRLQKKAKEGKL